MCQGEVLTPPTGEFKRFNGAKLVHRGRGEGGNWPMWRIWWTGPLWRIRLPTLGWGQRLARGQRLERGPGVRAASRLVGGNALRESGVAPRGGFAPLSGCAPQTRPGGGARAYVEADTIEEEARQAHGRSNQVFLETEYLLNRPGPMHEWTPSSRRSELAWLRPFFLRFSTHCAASELTY